MLGKLFFMAGFAFGRIRTKYRFFLQIIYLNYFMNVYNKAYYIISVNLIYLTLYNKNKIKTDKTKPHKTFYKVQN